METLKKADREHLERQINLFIMNTSEFSVLGLENSIIGFEDNRVEMLVIAHRFIADAFEAGLNFDGMVYTWGE